MINKILLATVCFSICQLAIVYGGEIPTLQELQNMASLEIKGTTVAKANDAINIADKAYFKKAGGIMANEGAGSPSIITLGYEVAGFAAAGEKLWEVRISVAAADSTRALRAILWINPRTEQVHFVCGPWDKMGTE